MAQIIKARIGDSFQVACPKARKHGDKRTSRYRCGRLQLGPTYSWWQIDEHSADVLASLPSPKELQIVDVEPWFDPTVEQLKRALPGVSVLW